MVEADSLAQTPLVVLDFDGTLCPIVSDPSRARISQRTLRQLWHLSTWAEVVILTGRSPVFIKRQLSGVRVQVIGFHGNGNLRATPELLRLLGMAKGRFANVRGVRIETKRTGFVVHYRDVPKTERKDLSASILRFAKGVHASVIRGRKSFEFIPHGAKTKAEVLSCLVGRDPRRPVLFIGDDFSDVAAIQHVKRCWNFRGALIRSDEVRAKGIRKICREDLFKFITEDLAQPLELARS